MPIVQLQVGAWKTQANTLHSYQRLNCNSLLQRWSTEDESMMQRITKFLR
jgi:hypothetical protein